MVLDDFRFIFLCFWLTFGTFLDILGCLGYSRLSELFLAILGYYGLFWAVMLRQVSWKVVLNGEPPVKNVKF